MSRKIFRYFISKRLIEGFIVALCGSVWLYMSSVSWYFEPLFILCGFISLWILIGSKDSAVWFWSGFFIAIFWFWWIGKSFEYYGISQAMPIAIVGIGIIYGLLFFVPVYIVQKVLDRFDFKYIKFIEYILKALYIYLIAYIHPFGFDWFKPQLMFVYTPLNTDDIGFISILLAIVILQLPKLYKLLAIIPLLYTYQPLKPDILSPDSYKDIYIVSTNIPLEQKWSGRYNIDYINFALTKTQKAIDEGKKLIIFPESFLPIFLNRNKETTAKFLKLSDDIAIVIGALYDDKGINRNSAYLFNKRGITVANKVVLVPFGEQNPLPKWLGEIVNQIFFDGATDYEPAKRVTDFVIDNKRYRSAICYEGTSQKLYEDNPKYMIVITNNSWFTPSIEPALQKALLLYYSNRYKTTIFHSINGSPSYIIKPHI